MGGRWSGSPLGEKASSPSLLRSFLLLLPSSDLDLRVQNRVVQDERGAKIHTAPYRNLTVTIFWTQVLV